MSSERQIRIRLIVSPIGCKKEHKATVRALGLHRVGQEVVKADSPSVRGMANAVRHLVVVSEEDERG
jgi:large subunit ribosomal protein L30